MKKALSDEQLEILKKTDEDAWNMAWISKSPERLRMFMTANQNKPGLKPIFNHLTIVLGILDHLDTAAGNIDNFPEIQSHLADFMQDIIDILDAEKSLDEMKIKSEVKKALEKFTDRLQKTKQVLDEKYTVLYDKNAPLRNSNTITPGFIAVNAALVIGGFILGALLTPFAPFAGMYGAYQYSKFKQDPEGNGPKQSIMLAISVGFGAALFASLIFPAAIIDKAIKKHKILKQEKKQTLADEQTFKNSLDNLGRLVNSLNTLESTIIEKRNFYESMEQEKSAAREEINKLQKSNKWNVSHIEFILNAGYGKHAHEDLSNYIETARKILNCNELSQQTRRILITCTDELNQFNNFSANTSHSSHTSKLHMDNQLDPRMADRRRLFSNLSSEALNEITVQKKSKNHSWNLDHIKFILSSGNGKSSDEPEVCLETARKVLGESGSLSIQTIEYLKKCINDVEKLYPDSSPHPS